MDDSSFTGATSSMLLNERSLPRDPNSVYKPLIDEVVRDSAQFIRRLELSLQENITENAELKKRTKDAEDAKAQAEIALHAVHNQRFTAASAEEHRLLHLLSQTTALAERRKKDLEHAQNMLLFEKNSASSREKELAEQHRRAIVFQEKEKEQLRSRLKEVEYEAMISRNHVSKMNSSTTATSSQSQSAGSTAARRGLTASGFAAPECRFSSFLEFSPPNTSFQPPADPENRESQLRSNKKLVSCEVDDLAQKLSTTSSALAEASSRATKAEQMVSDLHDKLRAKDVLEMHLRKELTTSTDKISNLSSALAASQASLERYLVDQAENVRDRATSHIVSAEHRRLQAEFDRAVARKASLEEENHELRRQLSEFHQTKNSLYSLEKEMGTTTSELRAECEKWRSKFESTHNAEDKLKVSNERLSLTVVRLRDALLAFGCPEIEVQRLVKDEDMQMAQSVGESMDRLELKNRYLHAEITAKDGLIGGMEAELRKLQEKLEEREAFYREGRQSLEMELHLHKQKERNLEDDLRRTIQHEVADSKDGIKHVIDGVKAGHARDLKSLRSKYESEIKALKGTIHGMERKMAETVSLEQAREELERAKLNSLITPAKPGHYGTH